MKRTHAIFRPTLTLTVRPKGRFAIHARNDEEDRLIRLIDLKAWVREMEGMERGHKRREERERRVIKAPPIISLSFSRRIASMNVRRRFKVEKRGHR